MLQNILVVCLGNICCSPITERLLQKKLPRHQISSAGFKVLTDNDADFQVIKTALKHDVIVAGHTTRQLTTEMCEGTDLIPVMEPEQIDVIANIHPSARGKTILFVQWLPKKTVPDPFNQSSKMLEAVYLQLEEAAQAWARRLNTSA